MENQRSSLAHNENSSLAVAWGFPRLKYGVLAEVFYAPQIYDARVADEAYKSGWAALAAGNIKEVLRSLKMSLSSCLSDKASSIAKLRSLIALLSQQQQQLQKPS